MNPFELRGPQFLVFYLVFAAIVILALHFIRRLMWSRQPAAGRLNLTDPYEIAYLRGGKNEAVRVAVIALIERGLLEVHNKIELVASEAAKRTVLSDPFEEAVLRFYRIRIQAADAFKLGQEIWEHALAPRRSSLERAGLLADAKRRAQRKELAMVGAVILFTVAATKFWIAYSAGRRNIGFLILFTLVAICFELAVLWRFRRTPRGEEALIDLRQLFDRGLPSAAAARSSGSEWVMTAAVLGMAALPASAMPYVPELYPRAFKESGGGASSSSGCGSSCGSSCGGGGGCGGGCGGCGS